VAWWGLKTPKKRKKEKIAKKRSIEVLKILKITHLNRQNIYHFKTELV
jgi:hypothetical protein